MNKNVANQKLIVYAFDSNTNLPKTGDASNLTAYVSKDWGAVTVLGDTSATEMDATNAKGYYLFDLTATETNATCLLFSAKSGTANVVVLGMPATQYTLPANFALGVISSGGVADANAVQFAGQTITAAAGVTVPSSIASPTNITAGTITTVTNLTNAPTVGDLTAAMIASVTTAATAATPTAAAVTGNVGGNVGGNVTGSVGSVAGNVGGNVTGSVGSIAANGIAATSIAAAAITAAKFAANAIDANALAADAVTEIWAKLCTEPAAVIDASPTAIAALSWLATLSRNRITQTATVQTLFADDGVSSIAAAGVSDDATTFERTEFA